MLTFSFPFVSYLGEDHFSPAKAFLNNVHSFSPHQTQVPLASPGLGLDNVSTMRRASCDAVRTWKSVKESCTNSALVQKVSTYVTLPVLDFTSVTIEHPCFWF